ncbi:MAG TPA: protein kinase [Gemmataceae bacterium]|jgi:WD40 repeat protein/serine/threonine protein kinase
MLENLHCPQGHQWDASDDALRNCPVCGQAAVTPPGGETVSYEAEPPPDLTQGAEANPPEDRTLPASAEAPVGPLAVGPRVPGFEILRELGRGGMAVVYLARQTKLNRLVALKMILSGGHAGVADLERFRAEAEAIAQLRHPHIVEIYSVGEHGGRPFFVLEFVDGGTLAQKLDSPLAPVAAAHLLEMLARGIHAAHQHGIIHRDLKPANILLSTKNEEQSANGEKQTSAWSFVLDTSYLPKIADFGLAKQLDADHGKTRTGAILGTPSYMSPEQAGGKKNLGPAADVYSLGAILYECLTGKPPFKADSPLDTVLEVIAGQVTPPRRLQPKIPRDLETICLKCLHKEPPRRYGTAQALAEDLRRFQEGVPILARPTPAWERSWRWLWRRPAALAAIVLLLAVLSVVGILYSKTLYRVVANRGQVVVESIDPGVRLLIRREGREVAVLEPGREKPLTLDAGDYDIEVVDAPEGLELSAEHFTVTRNGREVIQVRKEVVGELRRFDGHRGPVHALALSPDGRIALSGSGQPGSDRTLRLWDVATGHELRRLGRQDTDVETVAFAPDGRSALSAGSDGIVRLWDVQTGEMVRTFEGHKGAVHGVVFSPDGRQVLSCGADKTLRLWDAATGNAIRTLEGHTDVVWSAAFHPDGDRIVSAGADRTLRLWDTASGKERADFPKLHAGWVVCVAFHPDGHVLASGSVDGLVRIWDARTGKITRRLRGHTKAVTRVAFTPDGRHIVSSSADRTIRLWDAAAGRELRKLTGHTDGVLALALAPDGRHVLSAGGANLDEQWVKGRDFSLRWWALPRVSPKPLSQPSEPVGELLVLRGHTAEVQPVAFSPGGEYILSGGWDSTVRLWDAETGEEIRRFAGATGKVQSLAFSPDGKYALVGSNAGSLRSWDVATGKDMRRWTGLFGEVSSIAFSSDGKHILTGDTRQSAFLMWDAATGAIRRRFNGHVGPVESVAFSPDGKRALTGSFDRTIRLWDLGTGRELRRFTGHEQRVRGAVFSPDGKRVLSTSDDSTVRLWDAESGEELLCMVGHQGFVNAVAFSPNGRRAVSAGHDGTVRVWNLVSGQEVSSFKGHQGEVVSVSFAPDGSRVATGGRDRTVRVWQLPPSSDQREPLGWLVLDTDTPTVPLYISRAGRVVRRLNPPATRPVPLPAGEGYTVDPAENRPGLQISPAPFSLAEGATQRIEVRRKPDFAGEIMRLEEHSFGVMALAAAPKGDRLLSTTYDNQLRMWDLRSGKPLWTLANEGGPLLAFSPDGRRVAIASRIVGLWVRDAESGAKVSQLGKSTINITAIAFLPDGDRVLSAEQDGRLRLWDAATGKELRCLDGDNSWPTALTVSRDGKRILAGSRDGTLALWDVEKGEVIRLFAGRHAELGSVALSPDGKLALSVSNRDGAVFLWDVETGKQLRRLVGHKWMTLGAAFLPDGRHVLSWGTGQPGFILWEVPSGRPLHSSWLPPISVSLMAVAPAPASVPGSAALAAWGETNALIHVWQVPYPPAGGANGPPAGEAELIVHLEGLPGSVRVLQKGQVVRTVNPVQPWQNTAVPLTAGEYEVELDGGPPGTDLSPARFTLKKGEQQVVGIRRGAQFVGEVRRLAMDLGLGGTVPMADGRHFLAARAEGTLFLSDLESGRAVRRFDKGHTGSVWGLCVTPDGKRAVSAGQDGTLRVWDIATGKERARCNELSSQYRKELALSPDGKQVLCVNGDRFLLLDANTAAVIRRFPVTAAQSAQSVALSPDGRRALTGHSDGTVKLWDVAAGKEEGALPGRTAPVTQTAFAPNGRLALSADQGGVVRLWDVQDRKEKARIRLGRGPASSMTFTPDGRRFLVASWDGSVRAWDVETCEEVYRFASLNGPSALIFLDRGRLLLSNSQSLIVRQLPGKDHAEGQLAFESDGMAAMVKIKGEGKVVERSVYAGAPQVVDLKPGDYELELPRGFTSGMRLSAQKVKIQAGGVQVVHLRRVLEPWVKADARRVAEGERELKALLERKSVTVAERARLRADLLDLARRYRGLPPALSAAETLRRLPSPPDGLQRDRIPAALLSLVGGGKAAEAPPELVAVLDFRNGDGVRAPVSAFAFRGDGAALAAGSSGGLLKLWSLADGKELRSWTAHSSAVQAVAFSPDDRLLATASDDRRVVLWDPATGKKVRELSRHDGPVGAVAFSPDGQTLATGSSGERAIRLWRVADGELWKSLGEEKDRVTDLEFSPDGSLLLSGSSNNRIRLWNVAAGTIKRSWSTIRRQAHGLAFSPDGALVGTVGGSNALTLWGNSSPGGSSRVLYGTRPSALRCLAFRPDGREVAGAFTDGTIVLWDLETGLDDSIQLPSTDSFFQLNAIAQVGYSPDGRFLAVRHNRCLVSILRRTPNENKKP